jgi:hypothetical protein
MIAFYTLLTSLFCITPYNVTKTVNIKWLRYQGVISLETQVGITSQRNERANTNSIIYIVGAIRCLGGVSIPYRPVTPAVSLVL